jgi:hypothetical protein
MSILYQGNKEETTPKGRKKVEVLGVELLKRLHDLILQTKPSPSREKTDMDDSASPPPPLATESRLY